MDFWALVFGFGIIALMAGMIIGLGILLRNPERSKLLALRSVDAFDELPQKAGESIESGMRIHISIGSGTVGTQTTTGALAGITVLDTVAEAATISDKPPVVTAGDGGAIILAQSALRRAYAKQNVLERYDPLTGHMTGTTPLAFAAGAASAIRDETVSVSLLIGNFSNEIALIADSGSNEGTYQIVGTDNIQGQAAAYVTGDEVLVGEDVYASGAYLLGGKPFHRASLHAQDILRLLIIAAIPIGIIAKIAGFF